MFPREEKARLERAIAEIRAPLDRVVTPAEARRWIEDAFTGWSGSTIEVRPGPVLEGFAGQYRLFRVQGTCLLDLEVDFVRRLLGIDGAPRWLSGRRILRKDSVAWEVVLAFRAGPQPVRPTRGVPRRVVMAPTGVESLVPSPPPAPVRPVPGVQALARPTPPIPGFAVPTLGAENFWSLRKGEVSVFMGSVGRSPVGRVVAEGGPIEVPNLRVERTLVSPDRPWSSYAIIDGMLVRPGESVQGLGIRAILTDRVLLGEGTPIEVPAERGK